MSRRKDTISGVVIGGALGDSLGLPHERYRFKHEYTGRLRKATFHTQAGTRNYEPGHLTDDTEMSMCLFWACNFKKNEYDYERALKNYNEWANSTSMLGYNTKDLFKGYTQRKTFDKRYEKVLGTEKQKTDAQSNGALMRCLPFAFLKCSDVYLAQCIKDDVYMTNPNEITLECEIVFVTIIREILKKDHAKESLFAAAKNAFKNPILIDLFSKIKRKFEVDISGKDKGWVCYALYIAFYALMHTKTFQDGMDYIIGRGGDTDTNACIGGYLMGGFYGAKKMKENKQTKENMDVLMACKYENGTTKPRPVKYHFKPYYNEVLKVLC
jgi:ADP-ribosyl-[dinitrogen reductase] hydrolase